MVKKILILFGLAVIFLLLSIFSQFKKNIFSENLSPVSKIEEVSKPKTGIIKLNKETKIIVTGDIMLGRSVMSKSLLVKDFSYPFLKTADVLKEADITFGNLENPIIENCPISNDGMIFCSNEEMLYGLNFAGVDIVNLANNHTKNYGDDGLKQTQKFLQKEKIDYVGVDNLVIKNNNEIKFGFLGFDFVNKKPQNSDFDLIKNSKNQVDVLIMMVHWGTEYVAKSNKNQQEMAKKIIESGADVIVGGHPHWVQEMEYINEKPVFYSLGNFVFDQSWSEETKKGLVIRLNYQGKKLTGIDQIPIYMENFSQPKWIW